MPTDVANSSRKQADDVWAFDFRTPLCHTNASDDSDDADEPTVSNEAKLRQDLDLSTREEHVVYKPNPFSIAKANAAYRSNVPSKKVPPPKLGRASLAKATNPGQKTLLEGFEIQKKRITLPAPRTMPIPVTLALMRPKDTETETLKSAKEHDTQRILISKANAPPLSSNCSGSVPNSRRGTSNHVHNDPRVSQNAHIFTKAEQNDDIGPIDTCLDAELRMLTAYFSPILVFSRHC
ncbi:hypothetical protein HYPSUDRAFT_63685 [Hypholoma sublateritium FD-334 SS-4]|uniref:Uncharacterized protein n=1 Tax=Hypholoma sublateritium (strain FD-334 SS-4) TaxID=945553 RepID=A0A0D2P7H8_HYPSF|nr:hypothetical protein HYPSUDRAFT_63685 [Hypholoma sublateritium FD-334 SS-4]